MLRAAFCDLAKFILVTCFLPDLHFSCCLGPVAGLPEGCLPRDSGSNPDDEDDTDIGCQDRQAEGKQVTLASDANFDSPGYTAKYGLTIMQVRIMFYVHCNCS